MRCRRSRPCSWGRRRTTLALNVALHVGTLGSIALIYWQQLWGALKQPRLITAIVVATLPVVVVGLAFKDQLEAAFGSVVMVGCALCVTAGLLFSTKRFDTGTTELANISLKQALVVGVVSGNRPDPRHLTIRVDNRRWTVSRFASRHSGDVFLLDRRTRHRRCGRPGTERSRSKRGAHRQARISGWGGGGRPMRLERRSRLSSASSV